MMLIDSLCRRYQTLFRHNHPEQARLVELHSDIESPEFLRAYFDHEYHKGAKVMAGFARVAEGWQGGRTLDFGCGAGGLTYQIAMTCREAVGIDLEAHKLDFARAQSQRLGTTNAEFVHYDGRELPFADNSFDCIVCVDVVEHLPTLPHFVAEFRRALVPGGQLLLSFGPQWGHAHGKHMWSQLPGWWTHLLFPRRSVMRVSGFPAETTWEQLGMHRLSVSNFHRVMAKSGLKRLYLEERVNRAALPLKALSGVRELVISEVVGVYRKPA